MTFLLSLPIDDLIALIRKAYDMRKDDRLWDRWLVELAHMNADTFVSFDEYKQKFTVIPTAIPMSQRSREDILAEAAEIRRQIAAKKGGEE